MQRPGEGNRLHTTPSKKSKDGLKGESRYSPCPSSTPVLLSSSFIFLCCIPSNSTTFRLPICQNTRASNSGIISSLAFSASPSYYAAGSLTPATLTSDNIALFTEDTREPIMGVGGVAGVESGGVTQVSVIYICVDLRGRSRLMILGPCALPRNSP